jgi:serine phosphatase RsbU (regulator of sigma subunit)
MCCVRVLVGSAKTPKSGVTESGDTLELVERRKGGVSVVMADGQGSGQAAKRVSAMVVARTTSLIADGVRDGAAARAAHDFLFAFRDGKVSCELIVVSADVRTKTLVVSRNSRVPVIVRSPGDGVTVLAGEAEPIGLHEAMKPSITQVRLEPGLMALAMTDGITEAGSRTGLRLDIHGIMRLVEEASPEDPQGLAEMVLSRGAEADGGRLMDDMCVVVMSVAPLLTDFPVRKLTVEFPVVGI